MKNFKVQKIDSKESPVLPSGYFRHYLMAQDGEYYTAFRPRNQKDGYPQNLEVGAEIKFDYVQSNEENEPGPVFTEHCFVHPYALLKASAEEVLACWGLPIVEDASYEA